MRSLPYFLLDVFTNEPFGGNPLAVFPDADDVPDELMQKIANELNLSETTFIQKARAEGSDCTVRIFTPQSEIPMAGHPTIGTAYAVLANRLLDPGQPTHLIFDEGVGPVRVDFEHCEDKPCKLVMHQRPPQFFEPLDHALVANALSLNEYDLEPNLPVQIVSCGFPFILAPARSLDAVRRAKVRLDLLESKLGHLESQELLVFTQETVNRESDIHCRMFAPRLGVPEDPATGGAHGPLGSYLVRHGLSDGKHIVSEQGYAMGRPSKLVVGIESVDGEITDVSVSGECVQVGEGTIRL